MMEPLLQYVFGHPPALIAVVVLAIGGFVWWLAAPVTWRGGEGDLVSSGENFAAKADLWETFTQF